MPNADSPPPISRRTLLKTLPLVSAWGMTAVHALGAAQSPAPRKLRWAGWQVGVTYQTPEPGGITRDGLMRLLDEMTEHRMNLLSLMMQSYGFFDPGHDGYGWPVRKETLNPYRDDKATNAQSKTEFVRNAICQATSRGIQVQLFLNWGIWNPARICQGYPTAVVQCTREEAAVGKNPKGWLHCPDSPGAWRAGLDEAADLLTFYDDPNVTSYGLERLSYGGQRECFCRHTQDRFRADTGESLLDADAATITAWKAKRIGAALADFAAHVRRVKPGTAVWLHTQCPPSWGHDPAMMRASGIDALMPHTIQFPETKDQIHGKLRRLAPNPCVLHFCTRDQRPQNYKLWIKTPEILAEAFASVLSYPGKNLAGLLFFNPHATSFRNRRAVYENLRRFDLG